MLKKVFLSEKVVSIAFNVTTNVAEYSGIDHWITFMKNSKRKWKVTKSLKYNAKMLKFMQRYINKRNNLIKIACKPRDFRIQSKVLLIWYGTGNIQGKSKYFSNATAS
jgi:hypothetical protein